MSSTASKQLPLWRQRQLARMATLHALSKTDFVLYGAAALNMYLDAAFHFETEDLDVFCAANSIEELNGAAVAFLGILNESLEQLPGTARTGAWNCAVHIKQPPYVHGRPTTLKIMIGSVHVADMTMHTSKQIAETVAHFPRERVTVMTSAYDTVQLHVASLNELLHRMCATITNVPCVDGFFVDALSPDTTLHVMQQQRIVKDSQRLDRLMHLQGFNRGFLIWKPRTYMFADSEMAAHGDPYLLRTPVCMTAGGVAFPDVRAVTEAFQYIKLTDAQRLQAKMDAAHASLAAMRQELAQTRETYADDVKRVSSEARAAITVRVRDNFKTFRAELRDVTSAAKADTKRVSAQTEAALRARVQTDIDALSQVKALTEQLFLRQTTELKAMQTAIQDGKAREAAACKKLDAEIGKWDARLKLAQRTFDEREALLKRAHDEAMQIVMVELKMTQDHRDTLQERVRDLSRDVYVANGTIKEYEKDYKTLRDQVHEAFQQCISAQKHNLSTACLECMFVWLHACVYAVDFMQSGADVQMDDILETISILRKFNLFDFQNYTLEELANRNCAFEVALRSFAKCAFTGKVPPNQFMDVSIENSCVTGELIDLSTRDVSFEDAQRLYQVSIMNGCMVLFGYPHQRDLNRRWMQMLKRNWTLLETTAGYVRKVIGRMFMLDQLMLVPCKKDEPCEKEEK